MHRFIIPRIAAHDVPRITGSAIFGALIAGCYGILHDQVTYTLGPEYFTRFKFQQFAWANPGGSDRLFVACIGFLATWWVGLIVGWILARRFVPNRPLKETCRLMVRGFAVVIGTGFLMGCVGYLYGCWRESTGDLGGWKATIAHYGVSDPWPFLRVGFIHNAGYLGGLLGLVLTYFAIRPADATRNGTAPLSPSADVVR